MIKTVFVLNLLISFSAFADFDPQDVKVVKLQPVQKKIQDVDMGTTHEDGHLKVIAAVYGRQGDKTSEAKVIHENLATCDVFQVKSVFNADFYVSFDVENDGGFNDCTIRIPSKQGNKFIRLGAVVGE